VREGLLVPASYEPHFRVPSIRLGRTASAPLNSSLKPKFLGHPVHDSLERSLLLQSRALDSSGGLNQALQKRRESFLYRQDLGTRIGVGEEESPQDDQIITPFAQILASLKEAKENVCRISNGSLARQTVEGLDWCLSQLEHMQSHTSVADLAKRKFQDLLNKELNILSASGESGRNIRDHITSTYYEKVQDELDESEDEEGIVFTNGSSGPHSLTNGSSRSSVEEEYIKATKETVGGVEELYESQEDLNRVMNINSWGLDVFAAQGFIRDKRILTCLTFKIFEERDLLKTFKISSRTLFKFLMSIEDQYLKDVPYHSYLHAADVTQSTHYLLSTTSLAEIFTPLEVLSAVLASCVHDVAHPGLTNQYLVATDHRLALIYNDQSVLENHHVSTAFQTLQQEDCDILGSLTTKQRSSIRKMVIDMVLATDMTKHMSLLADLKTMVETKKVAGNGVLLLDNYNDRIKVLQNLIHCCDVSNPTKPLSQYTQWVELLMEESFKQGDKERSLNLPISPLCDRNNEVIEKSQVGFITFIVSPLWENWAELIQPDAQHIMQTLENNRLYYQGLVDEGKQRDEKKS